MSAGLIAAALPFSWLRLAVAVALALVVRGSKRFAFLPAALSLALPVVSVATFQFRVGCGLWPGGAADPTEASAALAALDVPWTWGRPWECLRREAGAVGGISPRFLGPLVLGMAATGVGAAGIAYPLTIVGVWTWRAWRSRRRLQRDRASPPPLRLPAMPEITPQEALARYARKPERFLTARGVELLVDGGQTFGQMLRAIESARQSVELEIYILRDDGVGRRFQEALCRAARRGVAVRVLYDYIGSLSLPSAFVDRLLESGIAVGVYNPPVLRRLAWGGLNLRNHRKTLIVDGQVTFTGGMNIADDYAPVAEGGAGWRDTDVRIEGSALADQAALMFDYAWRSSVLHGTGGVRHRRLRSAFRRLMERWGRGRERLEALEAAEGPAPSDGGDGLAVRLLGNREFGERHRIHRAYLHAIRRARGYILIENAYFIPTRAVRRALARAVRRGVVVAVAVARDSDVKIAAYAGRYLYGRMLTSGVRLFEWPAGMLHAKTAVIDDAWSVVGSYNLDHRSLFHQLESAAEVAGAAFARCLRDQTLEDLSRCREVTLAVHESRPLYLVLMESAAYLLRHWL